MIHYSEKGKIVLITLLYTLQGIPQGLANLIPILLIASGCSYSQVAIFSITYYPYTLKILWSPLVDSIYSKRIGRRKSWILPTQFIISLIFIIFGLSTNLDNKRFINKLIDIQSIKTLTLFFFLLFFCSATQDIALDAWAVAQLSKDKRHLTSTCQTAGLIFGNFLGYNAVITLTSPKTIQKLNFLFKTTKIDFISLGSITLIYGWVVVIATMTLLFVPEIKSKKSDKQAKTKYKITEAYFSIKMMCKNALIRKFCILILISVVPFAANMFLKDLYLIEIEAIDRNFLALLDLVSIPLSVFLSFLLLKNIKTSFLTFWMKCFSLKLIFNLFLSLSVLIVTELNSSKIYFVKTFSLSLYLFSIFHLIFWSLDKAMFIYYFAFCSQVVDESYGGTYLTFLAVIYNMAHAWVKFLSFGTFDWIKRFSRRFGANGLSFVSFWCVMLGFILKKKMWKRVKEIEKRPLNEWKIIKNIKDN